MNRPPSRDHRGVVSMEKDLAYYRRRSAEEAAAARTATNMAVQAVHGELARLYEERIAGLEASSRGAELRLVTAA